MSTGRLEGLGIVITRPRAAAELLAAALAREGARAFVFPALEIEDVAPTDALDEALAGLPRAAWAVFVSANAAEKGLQHVLRAGPWPAGPQVAAIGEATASALRNSGIGRVISPPGGNDSEALLAMPQMAEAAVAGKEIVIFRGIGGREHLRRMLTQRGARVSYAECYRRTRPAGDPAGLLQAWSRGEVQAVSALSAETLANFVDMVGTQGAAHMAGATLLVPHAAVAAHADAARFGQVLVTEPGVDGIIRALAPLRTHP
jgi:uroporphyrinogen-III synthase